MMDKHKKRLDEIANRKIKPIKVYDFDKSTKLINE
jgi:hypothetical protein